MTFRQIVATSLVVVALAACSDDGDDDTAPPTTVPPTASGSTDIPDTGSPPVDAIDPTTSSVPPPTTVEAPAVTDVSTTIGTVPEDGVPGIDSADAFCRAWSEFAGSFQALAVATSFGSDPEAPARLEVAASPVLVDAVESLDANLPAELEVERTAFVDGLAGPLARRAGRARSELTASGLSAADIDELGAAWLTTLAASGLDDPEIHVTLPDGVDAGAYGSAVDAFRDALPPINQDPSLITDAQTPLTDRYLADNCPDQGTLGGNDVIDQF